MGYKLSFFQGSRGSRHGFLLSPSLYITIANSLSRKVEMERLARNLPGIELVRGVKSINHSQFTNDTLLLGGESIIIIRRFNKCYIFLQGT
jgi:hypothetical protein